MLDLVIAAGNVVDGSRDAIPVVADVGIVDGLIADVGELSGAARRRTVDAAGRVVGPGFIDTHTHVEMASLTGHPDRLAPVAQGITTTLVGADGFGWVGLGADARRWWDDVAAIYGPSPTRLPDWPDPASFMADLAASSPTSVVPLAPQGSIRAAVMSGRPGPPTPAELDAMRGMVVDWMDVGAVGLATGLDYLPGRLAETDEIVALAEVVAGRRGVYASHLRLHDRGRAAAWREAAEISDRSGAPLRIAHERLDAEASALLAEVSGRVDVTLDSYLYPAGCTSLAFHVPKDDLMDGVTALSRRLAGDDAFAARMADHLDGRIIGTPGQDAIVAATTSGRHEGRSMGDLAEEAGISVGEMAVRLLIDEMPGALVVYVWQAADDEWRATEDRTITDPHTLIATDGVYRGSSPHPRGFGAFPRVLADLVRDRGVVTLGRAVHAMTGGPAEAYRLDDRGLIEPGRRADIVVFDPDRVDGPADWARPRTSPVGIDHVLVEGRDPMEEQR